MTTGGIRDGQVLMRDNRMPAAVVAEGDACPPRRAVIDYFAERLPAYSVPNMISFVPRIPRTAVGRTRRT